MLKIFIDTNKYLDFYRYKNENKEILNKLEICNHIILVEQVIDEFYRNRNKELHNLKNKIKELNSKINPKIFNIDPIGVFSEKIKVLNSNNSKRIEEIKTEINLLESYINKIINSKEEDIIFNAFQNIINNNKTIIYKHNDDCYKKAEKRNNLGGIPRSEKNGFKSLTICDEYIWETLLTESKYDICFITRDKTYLENKELLEEEYSKKTGKKIIFVETINEGLTLLGTSVSKFASEIENINNYNLEKEETLTKNNLFTEDNFLTKEQQQIYDLAIRLSQESVTNKKKKILIINAPTGCGKTTIAINLLKKFLDNNYKSTFVSSRSATRYQFYEKLSEEYRKSYLKNLINSSGSFTETKPNTYDCIIVDDAQGLHYKSGLFRNIGNNQIKELIDASYFTIFFVDEHQKISLNDIGTISTIKKYANELNSNIEISNYDWFYLFNNNYIVWIYNILYDKYHKDNFVMDYDFKVFYNPHELKKAIDEKSKENYIARIVAGYCWDWKKSTRGNTNANDIFIPEFNFELSWNNVNSKNWLNSANAINEAGSIHTVSGVNFDYVGVIIGEDLRYENNSVITDFTKRAKTDQSLKGIYNKIKENKEEALKEADEIIKNTYNILLTRGKKGCYVFCIDKELGKYLEKEFNKYKKESI